MIKESHDGSSVAKLRQTFQTSGSNQMRQTARRQPRPSAGASFKSVSSPKAAHQEPAQVEEQQEEPVEQEEAEAHAEPA